MHISDKARQRILSGNILKLTLWVHVVSGSVKPCMPYFITGLFRRWLPVTTTAMPLQCCRWQPNRLGPVYYIYMSNMLFLPIHAFFFWKVTVVLTWRFPLCPVNCIYSLLILRIYKKIHRCVILGVVFLHVNISHCVQILVSSLIRILDSDFRSHL